MNSQIMSGQPSVEEMFLHGITTVKCLQLTSFKYLQLTWFKYHRFTMMNGLQNLLKEIWKKTMSVPRTHGKGLTCLYFEHGRGLTCLYLEHMLSSCVCTSNTW